MVTAGHHDTKCRVATIRWRHQNKVLGSGEYATIRWHILSFQDVGRRLEPKVQHGGHILEAIFTEGEDTASKRPI